MKGEQQLPADLQKTLSSGVLKRLPLTFLPFVNQQLRQWEFLFPRERQSVQSLLNYVSGLTPESSTEFFKDVVQIEEKMGVRHWQFSTNEQTIQNSSELARSPYFQEWRRAVQGVFDAADQSGSREAKPDLKANNRLILLNIPHPLPIDAATAWQRWQGSGRALKLDPATFGASGSAFETLLTNGYALNGVRTEGLLHAASRRPQNSSADTWVVDAGRNLVDAVLGPQRTTLPATLLSYSRLDLYRQSFSHEMNTMRKDLADADAVFDRLRSVDVNPWCPPEVAADPAVREFLRSLYLTGNGAVIFGNSFAEWAASEALRRARPSFIAVQFGTRSKPKPFTGVAVFDNPDQVNPLPAVDDLQGSAIDAQMLALYVWLSASRYEEYQHSTMCVCMAESLSQAYVIAPPESPFWSETQPIPLPRFADLLRSWMVSQDKIG